MDTKKELDALEQELNTIRWSSRLTNSILILIIVILSIFLIYLTSYYFKKEIHDAIQREDIPNLVSEGFDEVMSNYQAVE